MKKTYKKPCSEVVSLDLTSHILIGSIEVKEGETVDPGDAMSKDRIWDNGGLWDTPEKGKE